MKFNPVIITGQPGSGKTSLIEALKAINICCVDEPGRKIIIEQREVGGRGTSDQDPELFISLMLKQAVIDYKLAEQSQLLTVFDRGIPDLLSYAEYYELDSTAIWQACDTHRYDYKIFYAPPWQEIYTQDMERTMTFEQARSFGQRSYYMYEKAGYKILELPLKSIEDRVNFMVSKLRI